MPLVIVSSTFVNPNSSLHVHDCLSPVVIVNKFRSYIEIQAFNNDLMMILMIMIKDGSLTQTQTNPDNPRQVEPVPECKKIWIRNKV